MNKMKRIACLFSISLLASGCGGGGGGGGGTSVGGNNDVVLSSLVVGIEVPSEISAVPADNSDQSQKATYQAGSFSAAIRSLLAAAATSDLSSASDYAVAEPSVYVEERALEQFDIIEQVFGALAQTNYAKEENVNQGPYKAMIAWKDEQNGKSVKTLQTWTVESQMIVKTLPSDVTGNATGDTNRLLAWIPETDRETGQEQLVKAEFLIYTAPTKSADGSLVNYGEWDMNVLMRASTVGVDTIPTGGPVQFFVASARIGSGGVSVLKVHDGFQESFGGTNVISAEMKGILYRNGTSGYGQVSYPDWEACWQFDPLAGASSTPPCANGVPVNLAKYAYNANYLGVQQTFDGGTPETAVYKDRSISGAIRLVHRYDLFYADADTNAGVVEGDNIAKHVNFGFPVSFEQTSTDGNLNTFNDFGFYGAWQGRHQLWVGGSFTPTGGSSAATVFTRQDVAPGQTAPTYNVKEFNGTFTMRALVNASLSDIRNVAVETWLNDNYDMIYFDPDATGSLPADWQYCTGYIDWFLFDPMATTPVPPICRDKANTDNNTNAIAFVSLHGADGVLGGGDDSDLLGQLSVSSGERRNVNINQCDQTGCTDYVYLKTDPTTVTWSGAGFYAAEWGMEGLAAVSGASKLTGSDGNQMWINIGGSIYVAYDGDFSGSKTGWVQKTLASFDQETWTPTFTANGDSPFTPERGYQYYMNANGQNYVVTRTDADASSGFQVGDYAAKLELQTAANPANTNLSTSKSVLPAGTAYLASPWDNAVKYTLVDDPNDANGNYLLLVVKHDSTGSSSAGSPATSGIWGLVAYADGGSNNNYTDGTGFDDDGPIASDGSVLVVDQWGWVDPANAQNAGKEPVQFNWEYADEQNPWGKQQFLVYASGSSMGDYVILSDQISLAQVGLYDNLGAPVQIDTNITIPVGTDGIPTDLNDSNWKKVNLRFDGWLHGLPDMYRELQNNDWQFTPEMAGNIRRLKEGQKVFDGTRYYFVKPMETSLFLGVVNAFPQTPGQPDISAANSADLNTVPDYVHHEMGAAPTTKENGDAVVIKYSEGQPIE